jgi:hypothetical protein
VTVVQTVLVFVGIPGAIILLIFLATYGRSLTRQPNRYRPGKPWNFEPTWYVPHPDAVVHHVTTGNRELEAGASHTTAVGGASGEW